MTATYHRSFLDAILKPFKWPFAIIYSLPQDFYTVLESPMPFMAGINIAEADFNTQILPGMKRSQKNRIMIVILDSNTFVPYEFTLEQDLLVPSLNNVWSTFLKDVTKYHWIKKSRCIEFEKKESPQFRRDIWRFKLRLKPDKKVTKQKPKPPATLAECKSSIVMKQTMCSFSRICFSRT